MEYDIVEPMFLLISSDKVPVLKKEESGAIVGQFAFLEHWETRTTYYYNEAAQDVLEYSSGGATAVVAFVGLVALCFPEPTTSVMGAAMLATSVTGTTYAVGAQAAALAHEPKVTGVTNRIVGEEIIVIPYE